MTAALAFLTSPIGAYIVSRLGSKLMREHGGTLWFKIGSVLFNRLLKPKKTDAQNLLDRLDAEGVKLTKAQRAKLSQEDQDLIDHV